MIWINQTMQISIAEWCVHTNTHVIKIYYECCPIINNLDWCTIALIYAQCFNNTRVFLYWYGQFFSNKRMNIYEQSQAFSFTGMNEMTITVVVRTGKQAGQYPSQHNGSIYIYL